MLSFSQRYQPKGPQNRGVPTDGREFEQGKLFHQQAKPGCGDDKNCLYGKCSALCANWVPRTSPDGGKRHPVTLNQIYFNCTGTCWDPDGGT